MAKILVVDDEPLVLELLRELLQQNGHTVVTARHGTEGVEAVSRVASKKFDLIITDLAMPQANGFDFLSAIARFRIPVMVLTAHASRKNLVASIHRGAKDFMNKNGFQKETLIDKVNKMLKKNCQKNPKASAEEIQIKKEASISKDADETSSLNSPTEPSMATTDDQPQKKPSAKINKQLSRIREIKALPFVASEIIRITDSRDSSAQDLVSAVTRDQAIASKVIQMANSVFYKSSKNVRNFDGAVINIGFSGIRELALGLSVIDHFLSGSGGLDRMEIWRHSLLTAALARALAKKSGHENPESAFLAGLLHDIGRVILDEAFPEEFAHVVNAYKTGEIPEKSEKTLLGLTHTEVARLVLDNWKFEESLRDAVIYQDHDAPTLANLRSKDQQIIALTLVANTLAEMLPFSSCGHERLRETDARFLTIAGVTLSDIRESLQKIESEFRNLESILLMQATPTASAPILPEGGHFLIKGPPSLLKEGLIARYAERSHVSESLLPTDEPPTGILLVSPDETLAQSVLQSPWISRGCPLAILGSPQLTDALSTCEKISVKVFHHPCPAWLLDSWLAAL